MAASENQTPLVPKARVAAEKGREAQERAALERVSKLRDRFSLSTIALSVVATLMAVWVRAPTLEIELPLGEAKASLNVGYVLALGIPVISIVYAVAIGNLVGARRYQYEILHARRLNGQHADALLLLQLGAPSAGAGYFGALDWLASKVSKTVIGFVLFVVPAIACGWIGYDCLTNLFLFPANPTYVGASCNPNSAPIDCRHVITLTEHFFGLKAKEPANAAPQSDGTREAIQFGVTNGVIEKACREEWRTIHDPQHLAPVKSSEQPAQGKCVFEEFPRFLIPLTFWINFVFASLTAALGVFGMSTYWRLPNTRT